MMRMRKQVSSLLSLALALMMAIPIHAARPGFSDVDPNHWAGPYINTAYENGWVSGVGNGKYAPSQMVTTAEWLTMLTQFAAPDQAAQPARAGTWYEHKWYGPYVQAAMDLNFDRFLTEKTFRFDEETVEREANRGLMACFAAAVLYQNNYRIIDGEKEETAAKIPDLWVYGNYGEPQRNGIILTYRYGVICGIDETGRFDAFGEMTRAEAATVLCNLAEAIKNKPAVPVEPPEPPAPVYGPVGTLCDQPVTLSYETHKPVVDYWSQNSEQFKARTDRDTYNAAVQSLKDIELTNVRNGTIGTRNRPPQGNIYYNYAVFNFETATPSHATSGAIGDSSLLASVSLESGPYGPLPSVWIGVTNPDINFPGHQYYDSYVEKANSCSSDMEAAAWCMKAMTDQWTYGYPQGSWREGQFTGVCMDLAPAFQSVMRKAGLPCIITGDSNHTWTYVRLDGEWYVADPTIAVEIPDHEGYDPFYWKEDIDVYEKTCEPGIEKGSLFVEGSAANIAMHFIEQAGWGR